MSGIFGTKNKIAAPLSYTPVSGFALRGLHGALGASNVPGTCWDVAGFKDCHAAQWKYAQQKCAAGEAAKFGGDQAKCIEAYTDDLAWVSCVPQYCPQTSAPARKSGSDGIPVYGDGKVYNKVKALQALLNSDLKKLGYNLLGTDGKLGKGTCGATLLASYKPDAFPNTMAKWDSYVDVSSACTGQAYVMPTPKAGSANIATDFVAWVGEQVTKAGGGAPPWLGDPNAGIQQWQAGELNTVLTGLGYDPIVASGQIDAPTCGAMQVSDAEAGTGWLAFNGKNCQAFTKPTKKIKIATPVVIPPPSAVTPTGPAPVRTSQASMATTGLVALVAVGGAYLLNRRYHWW